MIKTFYYDIHQLQEEDIFERYYSSLSDERRNKVLRAKFPGDKKRSLAAGILIDKGLSEYGLRERDIIYGKNENGKPFFRDNPEIHFNLSHSGDYVMAVFSDKEIGCDIQQMKRADLRIAKRFYAPEEYEYVMRRMESGRQEAFYRIWVLKESFLKAVGTGMALSMTDFSIQMEDDRVIGVRQNVRDKNYLFEEYDYVSGYKAASCLELPK